MDDKKKIVPEEISYLWFRLLTSFIVLILLAFVACAAFVMFMGFSSVVFIWFLFAVLLIVCLKYMFLRVSLGKEHYSLTNSLFMSHGGGLFSDYENELNVKNITQVKLVLPFWEYMFFKTGHILIESAGASSTEIKMRSIRDPESAYDFVIECMRNAGFKLSCNNLVSKMKPHALAVFLEVFQSAIGILLFAGYLVLAFFGEGVNLLDIFAKYWIITLPLIVLAVGAFLTYSFLYYCDLIKRVYSVYDDAIEYKEGFLNKAWAVIPIENISDSSITQGVVSRMFGLYDVKLSCQGASQEILFKNIVDGDKLSNTVDDLIDKFKSNVLMPDKLQEKKDVTTNVERQAKQPVAYDREYTYKFTISVKKIWTEVLVFLPIYLVIFPLFIFRSIYAGMANSINTYKIKKDSVEHTFKFIQKQTKEFSFEKITGIIFKESFLDKWCGTCSLLFWSIGSGDNFNIPGVSISDDVKSGLLAKKGIRQQKELYCLKSKISVGSFIKSKVFSCLAAVLILLVGVIAFPVLPFVIQIIFLIGTVLSVLIVSYVFFYYEYMSLTFYEDYVKFKKGVVIKQTYYVLYNDIKDIETTKYFWSNKGQICFNVAGEIVVKTQNGQYMRNCAFSIAHLDAIDVLDEIIDLIFHKRPTQKDINSLISNPRDTGEESLLKVKPSPANYLIPLLVFLVPFNCVVWWTYKFLLIGSLINLLFGLVVMDVMLIWIILLNVNAITYCMQSYRVLRRSGVFYKRQKSIIYDKIDFINNKQGFINKLCSNGNISINTVGSSSVELELKNMKNFKQFYELLKQKYSSQK